METVFLQQKESNLAPTDIGSKGGGDSCWKERKDFLFVDKLANNITKYIKQISKKETKVESVFVGL